MTKPSMLKKLLPATTVVLLLIAFFAVPALAPSDASEMLVGFVGAGIVVLPISLLVALKGSGEKRAANANTIMFGLTGAFCICLIVSVLGLLGGNAPAADIGFWAAVWNLAIIIAIKRTPSE